MEHLTNNNISKDKDSAINVPKVIKHTSKATLTPLFYKDVRYYPLTISTLTQNMQFVWFAIYISIWACVAFLTFKPEFLFAYVFSSSFGMCLLLAEYYYTNGSEWLVINSKDNEAYEIAINKKSETTSISNNDNWLIYVNDKQFPATTDKAYLVESETINDLQLKEDMKLVPLGAMYDGLFSKTINIGSQDQIRYFSEFNNQLGQNCFYIIILILAWSLYIVKTKWFRIKNIYWVLVAIMISTLGGVLMNNPITIRDANRLIEIKKKILIVALSFACASILIN